MMAPPLTFEKAAVPIVTPHPPMCWRSGPSQFNLTVTHPKSPVDLYVRTQLFRDRITAKTARSQRCLELAAMLGNRNRRMLRSRRPEAPSTLSAAFEVAADVVCSKHGPRPERGRPCGNLSVRQRTLGYVK
jgi:hypothetical protein